MERNDEIRYIQKYLDSHTVSHGPTAFVCKSIQGPTLTREFIHSHVIKRGKKKPPTVVESKIELDITEI